ncbi:MAG: coniferyl-alcohol dehydrogenase [Chloroflexota bacterium]
MSLENKTIIVTGAASGIGAATAALLKEKGATVIGFDMKEPRENVDHYIPINLSDEASVIQAVDSFERKADALCNIAGVPPTAPPVAVIQVNFLGLRLFTELLIPKLNDNASIVNIASIAGSGWTQRIDLANELFKAKSVNEAEAFCAEFDINPEICYEFSKEAVIIWTMQNWKTWQERGIRINAVSPGPAETPILDDFMETVAARARAATEGLERPRPGRPNEIAPVIAFLCDSESSWINGANIPVDGGMFAAVAGHRMGF